MWIGSEISCAPHVVVSESNEEPSFDAMSSFHLDVNVELNQQVSLPKMSCLI